MLEQVARYPTVALVLQGGGALGAYQCGVYEGLHAAGIHPNWVAGTSIGAINAALIAGNAPEVRVERLRTFWETVCEPGGALSWPAAALRSTLAAFPQTPELEAGAASLAALAALWQGQRGFFQTRALSPFLLADGSDGATSFYDPAPLRATLERLVDFDRINGDKSIRLTIGTVEVTTGNVCYFDSRDTRIGPTHVMASGALPPAFPPIEIDGREYWDGGLVSNTPLEYLLEQWPREDTLALQVDLWSARGPRPRTMMDVLERIKDIQYSSRTRSATAHVTRTRELRTALTELIRRLPERKLPDELAEAFAPWLDDRVFNIVHLIYQAKPHEEQFKDYAFGHIAMHEHWQAGLHDTELTLAHPRFFALPDRDKGFAVHDVHQRTHGQPKPHAGKTGAP
ncbi:MAG TPA: patatin-like phospholipase family protein [Xanthomonadaceae bacterium]|nr:patatin-like phospholipase family protein [Xanthomonadaceae bacterium]